MKPITQQKKNTHTRHNYPQTPAKFNATPNDNKIINKTNQTTVTNNHPIKQLPNSIEFHEKPWKQRLKNHN